ncbi:unnamed protein product [marine sediment metagenome]|uniref:Uncharacterized protein n=1 Tax=marine sediment metagenome TaxID=412755 RepID=X0SYQ7_9ZZZZ
MEVIDIKINRRKYDDCKHLSVLVDEEWGYIECTKCGKHLDPIKLLHKIAVKQNGLNFGITSLKETIKKLENRLRTKCQHCGKMTKINC